MCDAVMVTKERAIQCSYRIRRTVSASVQKNDDIGHTLPLTKWYGSGIPIAIRRSTLVCETTFAEEIAMTIARKVLVNPTVTPLYHRICGASGGRSCAEK